MSLALAAASFIYIAVADLIPGLHRAMDSRSIAWQIVLIAAGIAVARGRYKGWPMVAGVVVCCFALALSASFSTLAVGSQVLANMRAQKVGAAPKGDLTKWIQQTA